MAVMRPTATGGFDILHFSSSSPSFRADARDDGGISADELCIRGTLVSASSRLHIVMAGLVPAIHAYGTERRTWMPGTTPGMTTGDAQSSIFALRQMPRECRLQGQLPTQARGE
ncbi:hypothetical protein SE92_31620 [Bradyrhizobium sp. AT1]|nr:hypothetical protein SE92_31620 [Bradyrhizobium sp. AT1]